MSKHFGVANTKRIWNV